MAEKKPTTKAHRGFIHIPKRGGGGRRPPRDTFNPFRPRRPRRPRFPFGRGRLGPADEPLDRRGRPIRYLPPIQGGRRRPSPFDRAIDTGIQPTPEQRKLMERQLRELANRKRRTTGTPTPQRRRALSPSQRRLMQRQLKTVRRQRRRGTSERDIGNILAEQQRAADNFRRLRDIAFRRSASAQRRAKGGMIFKSKDYVNPSNTVDNKKK